MTLEPHDSKQSQSKTNSQREDRCAKPRWEVSAKTQKRSTVFRVLQSKCVREVRLRWCARKIRSSEMLSYAITSDCRHYQDQQQCLSDCLHIRSSPGAWILFMRASVQTFRQRDDSY